jgi:hypothetical protein
VPPSPEPPPLSPRERDGVRVSSPRVGSVRTRAPRSTWNNLEPRSRQPLPQGVLHRGIDPKPLRVRAATPTAHARSTWNTPERLRHQPLLQDALHRSPPLKRVPSPSRYVPRGTRRTPGGPSPAVRSRTFHVEHPETAKPFRARNEPPQAPHPEERGECPPGMFHVEHLPAREPARGGNARHPEPDTFHVEHPSLGESPPPAQERCEPLPLRLQQDACGASASSLLLASWPIPSRRVLRQRREGAASRGSRAHRARHGRNLSPRCVAKRAAARTGEHPAPRNAAPSIECRGVCTALPRAWGDFPHRFSPRASCLTSRLSSSTPSTLADPVAPPWCSFTLWGG